MSGGMDECSGSGSKSSDEIWAKLVPSDSKYPEVEIRSAEVVICSAVTPSSLDNHEWCKITRNSDQRSAVMENKSSTAILVDETVVDIGDVVDIKSGTEIISGPDREGHLSYRFKIMPVEEPNNNLVKISVDAEHAKCSICLNIWHNVVTAAPCLHNFCNGCFSQWLKRSQQNHSLVLCPQCRAAVHFVGRNHFLHNIEEDILKADPLLRRPDDEIAVLDTYSSIQSNIVIMTSRRKRARSSQEEENDNSVARCPQCGNNNSGFRCNHPVHLQCHLCAGMMPARTDIDVPQHCLGCDRPFCGAYWSSQRVSRSDTHPMCTNETFRQISERTVTRIPYMAHEMNRHEQNVTERCIAQTGHTLQYIISDYIVKLNDRQIDRTRMPLNHAEMITAQTHLCNECFDKLVSFLLYWFRMSIPRHQLSSEDSERENCWYGYACRTQHHNEEHARKRNHVCRPTRGRNM